MQRSFDGLQGVGISQQLGEIAIGEALEIKSEVYLGQGIGSRIGIRDSNSIFGMSISYLSLSVFFAEWLVATIAYFRREESQEVKSCCCHLHPPS